MQIVLFAIALVAMALSVPSNASGELLFVHTPERCAHCSRRHNQSPSRDAAAVLARAEAAAAAAAAAAALLADLQYTQMEPLVVCSLFPSVRIGPFRPRTQTTHTPQAYFVSD